MNEFRIFLPGEQENVAITLDDAFGTFILNDRVVISLKGGEMYVIMTWNLF